MIAPLALDDARKEEAETTDDEAGDHQTHVQCHVHLPTRCNIIRGAKVLKNFSCTRCQERERGLMKPIKRKS